jgi:hypothetical protein
MNQCVILSVYQELMDRCTSSDLCEKTVHKHADKQGKLITRTDTVTQQRKMVILKSLQKKRLPNGTTFIFSILVKPEQS